MDIQTAGLLQAILMIISHFPGVASINITSVNIPAVVRAGTDEPVILDCNYAIDRSKIASLVIKWYIGEDQIYQWIHGMQPSGSREYLKYIDDTFNASADPITMYRAVKLKKLSHELSGEVRCSISTQFDETDAKRRMLVYSPETVFHMNTSLETTQCNRKSVKCEPSRLTVLCLAKELYPKPNISIWKERKPLEDIITNYIKLPDGRFVVEARATLDASKLKLPTVFQCEITLPDANYTSVREYVYNGGSVPRLSFVVLVATYLIHGKL